MKNLHSLTRPELIQMMRSAYSKEEQDMIRSAFSESCIAATNRFFDTENIENELIQKSIDFRRKYLDIPKEQIPIDDIKEQEILSDKLWTAHLDTLKAAAEKQQASDDWDAFLDEFGPGSAYQGSNLITNNDQSLDYQILHAISSSGSLTQYDLSRMLSTAFPSLLETLNLLKNRDYISEKVEGKYVLYSLTEQGRQRIKDSDGEPFPTSQLKNLSHIKLIEGVETYFGNTLFRKDNILFNANKISEEDVLKCIEIGEYSPYVLAIPQTQYNAIFRDIAPDSDQKGSVNA